MSGENVSRGLERGPTEEEEDALVRSVKKPKGPGELNDDTMDDEMLENEKSGGLEEEAGQGGGLNDSSNVTPVGNNNTAKGKKLVSYMDKVLCLNGEGYASESEEEDWITQQRKEEEEEELPDDVKAGGIDGLLCPSYIFSRKQHKEEKSAYYQTNGEKNFLKVSNGETAKTLESDGGLQSGGNRQWIFPNPVP